MQGIFDSTLQGDPASDSSKQGQYYLVVDAEHLSTAAAALVDDVRKPHSSPA